MSGTHTVTVIPGDGTGPEIVAATRRAIDAAGVRIDWDEQEIGLPAIAKHGDPFPKETLDSIRRNGIGLKGPLTTELGTGMRSVNVALRKEFDLYANLRPARTYEGVQAPMGRIDLVVVRENIEDLYAGIEYDLGTKELAEVRAVIEKTSGKTIREDAAIAIKYISEFGSRRIVKFAFEYARANGRAKVTAVHKANIMKMSDGLFLRCFEKVAKTHPEIETQQMIVDNASMQLVMRPEQFDILLCENLYGDIVSDLCAGLIGGLGLVPGANIGEKGAVFEAVHGSAPDIAGKGIANPTALLQSAILMLRHIEERTAADSVERAMLTVFEEGKVRTRDVGGSASTNEFADAIIAKLN